MRLTIAFFGSAAGEKVSEPIVIWRSAKPRCFKNLITLNVLMACIIITKAKQKYGFYVKTKISRKMAAAK